MLNFVPKHFDDIIGTDGGVGLIKYNDEGQRLEYRWQILAMTDISGGFWSLRYGGILALHHGHHRQYCPYLVTVGICLEN
ncbi:unnamed protein product [Trifolium pratense]|uniref:Uncharacterized protein n=1 Tax=Trifolium pratense TaxID=57577 RepID=A0ACB0KCM4_TRIPR|nr:unnamed protein product [Trifolium pratense]